MKLLIRGDANKFIATGHIMRCLSLADAVKADGGEVRFVCASEDPRKLIHDRGYEVDVMDTDYADMISELPGFKNVIEEFTPDVILCDSYYVSDEYFNKIKDFYKGKIAYMDDYSDHAFPVDVLINYNAYGKASDYEPLYMKAGYALPKMIMGPFYAPLRKEFLNPPKHSFSGKYEVLLSTGGADATHMAVAMLERFNRLVSEDKLSDVNLNILVGAFSEDKDAIMDKSVMHPGRVSIYSNITDMPTFLSKFDLAVSAAGSTTYELCCMKVPTVLFCTADNQKKIHDIFDENGLLMTAGYADKELGKVLDTIFEKISDLTTHPETLLKYSESAGRVTDGKGALKLCRELDKIVSE